MNGVVVHSEVDEANPNSIPVTDDERCGCRSGLAVENPPDPLVIDDKTLVENPTMAMLVYQDVKLAHEQGYFGHWSTLWSVAKKRL